MNICGNIWIKISYSNQKTRNFILPFEERKLEELKYFADCYIQKQLDSITTFEIQLKLQHSKSIIIILQESLTDLIFVKQSAFIALSKQMFVNFFNSLLIFYTKAPTKYWFIIMVMNFLKQFTNEGELHNTSEEFNLISTVLLLSKF